MAEKYAGHYARQFAKDLFNQMGVRVFFFIGYKNSDDRVITCGCCAKLCRDSRELICTVLSLA